MHYEQNTNLRKQSGFCLCEKCCKLVNHLCNLDGPLIFETGEHVSFQRGHVCRCKGQARTSLGLSEDRSTARVSEEGGHGLTARLAADTSRNLEQLWMLATKQVAQAGTGSGSRAERGRRGVLALSAAPSRHLQLKPDQQLFCKILLLQKSSSIICNKLNTQTFLPTDSSKFGYRKRTAFSWKHQESSHVLPHTDILTQKTNTSQNLMWIFNFPADQTRYSWAFLSASPPNSFSLLSGH